MNFSTCDTKAAYFIEDGERVHLTLPVDATLALLVVLRARDAVASKRSHGEPFLGDRLLATLADPVGRRVHPAQGIVYFGDPRPRRGEQRDKLGALEADGGTLGVVFVVGVRIP